MSDDATEIAGLLPSIAVNLRLGALFSNGAQPLSPNQILALLVLGREPGGMSSGSLAESLGISLPGVTAVADRLHELGLLHRDRDPGDRRVVLLGLSEKGLVTCQRVLAALETSVSRALDGLDPTMRANLLDAIRQVDEFSDRFTRSQAELVP